MIQAIKNNDLQGEQRAEELMQRLKRNLYAKGDDIAEDVDASLQELERSIGVVKDSLTEDEDFLEEFRKAEPLWDRINKYIRYLYVQRPAPRYVLEGSENKFPDDLELRSGERKYNAFRLNEDLEGLYRRHLLPINRSLANSEVGEDSPLKKVSESAKNTVRAHQYLHEYKQIIRIALEDEELRAKMINDLDDSGLGSIADDVWGQVEDLEHFNERLDQVEQKEQDILKVLEEAKDILQKKTKIDEQMLQEIANEFFPEEGQSSGGFLSGITGTSENQVAQEKFGEILQEYVSMQEEISASGLDRVRDALGESEEEAGEDAQDIQKVVNVLRSSEESIAQYIIPAVEQIREEEELDEKLDAKLISELEEYINDHRNLFEDEESADEILEEAEQAAGQDVEENIGQILQGVEMQNVGESAKEAFEKRVAEGGGPPGTPEDPRWRIFHEYLTEVIEMKREGEFEEIKQELDDIQEGYQNVYRIEGNEKNIIKEFEGEIKDIKSNMEEVIGDISDLSDLDMGSLRDSDSFVPDHVQEIVADIKQSREDLERMRADLMKTREFGNQEESSFELIQSRIEDIVNRTTEIKEDIEALTNVVERLKDETIGERSASEYADALMLSAMEIYGVREPRSALKDDLLEEIGEIKNALQSIGELDSGLKEKDHEEVEIEKEEIQEIYRITEQIKGKNGVYTEIKQEINPKDMEDLDKAVSGDVADAISGIANNLDRIAELLREAADKEEIVIKKADEEEAELREATDASREAAQRAGNLEQSVGKEVERLEEEFENQ